MSPILGILASSAPAPVGDYESIATVTVGSGGSSTISFTSIAGTYKHLQIRSMALSNTAEQNLRIRFNSDTGSNYTRHTLGSYGSGVFATGVANESYIQGGLSPTSTQPGVCVIDILDYTSTNKYKTSRALYGDEKNSASNGYIFLASGVWMNTAAITSIDLSYTGSSTFTQYTTFALYGIK